ncbi:MAG: 50S ribosomal protein L32 [Christensenellales bacterium]|jgi:large subunit ribosomal protein L32
MAVPKMNVSKSKGRMRRAHWKLSAPAVGECPQCHAPKLAHRVCKKCGYYDGRKAIEVQAAK